MNQDELIEKCLLMYDEIAELKEQIEYMHEVWEVLIEVTEAECQERAKRIGSNLLEIIDKKEYVDADTIRELRLLGQALKEGVK